MRFISHHEIEQRLVHDGMRAVIVGKLSMRDLICPRTRVGPIEDLKIGFNLLVDTFSFTIGLRVIYGGEGEVIVKEFVKFSSEGGYKLRTLIRDDLVIEPKAEVDFVEKESCYSLGSDGFL